MLMLWHVTQLGCCHQVVVLKVRMSCGESTKDFNKTPAVQFLATSTQYPARAYNTLRSFTLQSSRIAFLLLIILHTFIPTSALAHYAPHRLLLIQIRNPSYPHLYLYPHQNILLTEALACTSPRHHHTHLPILSYQYLVVLGWHR